MINLTEEQISEKWPDNWDQLLPLVSVWCIAFNHVRYIAQALDSFLMQITNFPFEIIVHDDASTDGTTDIIREYERKFPRIVKPIYETENQYSKKDGSLRRIVDGFCRGKYCASCEGDDYWTCSDKLQKQVDFLENHTEYIACAHNTLVIEMDGRKKDYVMHPPKDTILSISDLKERWHASSLMYQNDLRTKNWPTFMLCSPAPGDVKFAALLKSFGPIYRFGEVMSAYRHGTPGSWTKTQVRELGKWKNEENVIAFYEKFNEWTEYKYGSVSRWIDQLKFSLLLNKRQLGKARREYKYLYKKLPLKQRIKYIVLKILRR
ncbi:MAG: glycosyltransferase family 2 protein [Fibrobacter sp.]|nr:glycosyltransferase family 2 protein [Fibrobacter sp.]MDY6389295.1 glycosyltransferase family 2 protein [Fibrobacter sp.]